MRVRALKNLSISAQEGLTSTLHLKFQRVQQYSQPGMTQLFLPTVAALGFYRSGPKACFSWGFILSFFSFLLEVEGEAA